MAHLHVKTPNGTAYSIDLDAVSQIGFIPSSGNNGWGVLTNGAIVQWGSFTALGTGTDETFPVEFSFACYSVAGSSNNVNDGSFAVYNPTKTGFKGFAGGYKLLYIALGK